MKATLIASGRPTPAGDATRCHLKFDTVARIALR